MWATEMDHASVASFESSFLEILYILFVGFLGYSQSIGQHEEKSYDAVYTQSDQDKAKKCIPKKIQIFFLFDQLY